jgi:hypothetical protein
MTRLAVPIAIATSTVLLAVGCFSMMPSTFVRTHDEPGIWKSIEIKDGLAKDDVWRTVVDALSQKYDLEVIEKESGYLRTSWKYTYVQPGQNSVSDRYRSRIVAKFMGDKWDVVQVKCESEWLEPNSGWIMGYDSRLLEDVFGDLQGRVGRVRR